MLGSQAGGPSFPIRIFTPLASTELKITECGRQNAVAPSLCFASWSSASNQTNFSSKFLVFNVKLRKRLRMQVPTKQNEFKGEL